MTSETRAKIAVGNNSVELEGSEEFVSKYLDSFRALLEKNNGGQPATQEQRGKAIEDNEQAQKGGKAGSKPDKKQPRKKPQHIEPEPFDVDKVGQTPSLKEFFDQKKPGKNAGKRIAVISYYMKQIKNIPIFTEGNIDYAYKTLSLTERPVHIYQIIVNNKNTNGWFDEAKDDNGWVLTRPGEIFVEEKLPEGQDKK
jgi:hypothetical protein